MKGTGRWTIQEAAERSTAAPTMAAALDARYISGRKAERVGAAKVLNGPASIPKVPKEQLIEDMKAALYCSKICSYAQVCFGLCTQGLQGVGPVRAPRTRRGKSRLSLLYRADPVESNSANRVLFLSVLCSYHPCVVLAPLARA